MLNIIIVNSNKDILKEIETKLMAVSQDISIIKEENYRSALALIKETKPQAIVFELATLIQAGNLFAESIIESKYDIVIYHIGEFFQLVDGRKASSSAGYCLKKYDFTNIIFNNNLKR